MEPTRKIDRSFKERQRVLQLLETLKKENITYAEMDEIGGQIRKAGRTAVQPLLRRIWQEKNGQLISKYTYLLEFLDDRYWLDQIVQIALKRRDLEIEGRSAIMTALEDCGLDVTAPPFSTIFAGELVPVPELFSQMMANGEEGLLFFLEDFACLSSEERESFLFQLAAIPDKRVLEPLQLLLWHENPDVVKLAVIAIGRVRFAEAAGVLQEFQRYADVTLHEQISKSLRRLSFVGVAGGSSALAAELEPFYAAFASPLDGNGYRHVWLARWRRDKLLDSVELQLHDLKGIISVWGETGESRQHFDDRAAERLQQEIMEPVSPEYILLLLRDALCRNLAEECPLPPEFYLRRTLFSPAEIQPAYYEPLLPTWVVKATSAQLTAAAKLFDEEYFAGWCLESHKVYEIAAEWLDLEKRQNETGTSVAVERLLEILCREEFSPRLADIARRLVLNADYLARIGADGEIVKTALVAAESIRQFSLPCHLHPFIRRFAMESMIIAREALEEGHDLRDFAEDDNLRW